MTSKNKNHKNKLSNKFYTVEESSSSLDDMWSLIWNSSPQSQYKNIKRNYKRVSDVGRTVKKSNVHQTNFFLFFFFNWRIIALQNFAFAKSQRESVVGIHISPSSWTSLPSPSPSHPSRLLQEYLLCINKIHVCCTLLESLPSHFTIIAHLFFLIFFLYSFSCVI